MKCFRKIECQTHVKSWPAKISDFIKKMKPAVKFLTQKQRTNAVTPSTCNYTLKVLDDTGICQSDLLDVRFKFVDEVAENEANEQSECYENERNERLESRLRGMSARGSRQETMDSVRLYVTECREHMWTPLADADIRCRGDLSVTERQTADQQTPVPAF